MNEEMEETALPDDVVWEILLRVPADAATLFRCAATCKRWRAVVADLSFLRHHWPDNECHPSSLLGFFVWRRDARESNPLFFPISPGSVLGARRRSLASFVSGAPHGVLSNAAPLAARGSLLLVRLATGRDSLRLAVCDALNGTCDVLPPLNCTVSAYGCVVVAREDCWPLHGEHQGRCTPFTGYSTFFKVLAMIGNDKDCSLYTFSSSEPNWSGPRKCFDQVSRRILMRAYAVTVCHGVAYWYGEYSTDGWNSRRHFTFGVDVKTGQFSMAELPMEANQLAASSHFGQMLSVSVDGRLSLLHLQKEGLRLNTWTRGNDGTWLLARVIELKPPEQDWDPINVTMLSGEKSGVLYLEDMWGYVYKTDPETGVMEDVTMKIFQDSSSKMAVPIEIDWPALFMSRLAKRYGP